MGAKTLPEEVADRDVGRLQRYREYLDFYRGEQWTGRQGRQERRITFNYAKIVVDKVTSYVMADVNWAVDPRLERSNVQTLERSNVQEAEAILYEVAEANNLAQLDLDNEIDTAVLGDGCYKVIWDTEEKRVRITAPDVQGIFVWWAGDDIGQMVKVASRYQVDRDEALRLYRYRTTAEKVTITEGWTAQGFELWVGTDLIWQRRNPYGFIPFIVYPNLREPKQFWGVSDLAPIVEPARELNRALSSLSLILELSGNPVAVLENVQEAEDIAIAPGSVWTLPEDAKAYLLDLLSGGGVGLHVDYINLLFRTLHDLSETPRTAFGDNQKALSGVALEMELHPLLQKVRRKRLIRSAIFRQRNEMIFRLMEQFTKLRLPPRTSRAVWGAVLPNDRSRAIVDEVRMVNAGIHSRRLAADNLGVQDPQQTFAEWTAEEQKIRGISTGPQHGDTETRRKRDL